MLFNSIDFLLFFPIVFSLFLIGGKWRWLILLIASYFFYMSWKWEYIFLILISTGIDFLCGRGMDFFQEQMIRKRLLYLSILSNLSILFTFKYFNFFSEIVHSLFPSGSEHYLYFLLPVGISFYTFQTLSYSIDVYNRKIPAEKHLGYFALYVSYFPQLVAGPIERAGHLLHQFRNDLAIRRENLYAGSKLILWGLFKKVVIADRLAYFVDPVFNDPGQWSSGTLILATLFFGMQIYCDFSGYTDMALGISRFFNVRLIENFRRPYLSRSIGEFWNRWHISLSHWFRDYVYIPLGGNRVLKWRWTYNILITFLLSGLWHGANWTFVIWGLLHAFYLVLERWVFGRKKDPGIARLILTFILVHIAWIFFRANSLSDAFLVIEGIFSFQNAELYSEWASTGISKLNLVLGAVLFVMLYIKEAIARLHKPFILKLAFYLFLLFGVLLFGVDGSKAFIYFQF